MVPYGDIKAQLLQALDFSSVVLLRSEPQSGKTSFLNFVAKSSATIRGKEYVFRNLGSWTPTTGVIGAIVASIEARRREVLRIDEASDHYGSIEFGNLVKTLALSGDGPKVVLVGTTDRMSTITPTTPFDVPSYYMAPNFGAPDDLVVFLTSNFAEFLIAFVPAA